MKNKYKQIYHYYKYLMYLLFMNKYKIINS